jgi:hypothetical protein
MRRAQQREDEEHFATCEFTFENAIQISKFQIFNSFDENSKFKKITFKLFLKILKLIF